MNMMDEFCNAMRRIAVEVMGAKQTKGTLLCTAYNPTTHAVKGIIQPHGVESGWVPIAAIHTGPGYGIVVGPIVGDAQGNGGDQFDLDHEAGDPNTLVARHKQFSTQDTPPQVQSGEMLLQHASGNKVFFAQDKSVVVVGQNGSTTKHHTDGTVSVKPGTGKLVFTGGDPDDGGTFAFVQTVSGPSTTHKAKL